MIIFSVALDILLGYEEMEMVEIEEGRGTEFNIEAEESAPAVMNYRGQWASQILENAKPYFEQEGSEITAFYLYTNIISKKLLRGFRIISHMGKYIK